MAHRFDPDNRHKLNNQERQEKFPPTTILQEMGVQSGDTFLDVGCGTGYYSIPAAHIVGPEGKVIAYDVQPLMLEDVRKQAEAESLSNITLLEGEASDISLEDNTVDFVFLSNVLHEVDDKPLCLQRLHRITKNGSRIGIIEWRAIETDKGPPLADRLPEEKIRELLNQAGFRILDSRIIADTHTGIVAIRDN